MTKQSGFDVKEAAVPTRQLDQLNMWTQKVIELPDDAPGLFLGGYSH